MKAVYETRNSGVHDKGSYLSPEDEKRERRMQQCSKKEYPHDDSMPVAITCAVLCTVLNVDAFFDRTCFQYKSTLLHFIGDKIDGNRGLRFCGVHEITG